METVSYFPASELHPDQMDYWAGRIAQWTQIAHGKNEPILPQTKDTIANQFDQNLTVLAAVGETVIAHITAYFLAEVDHARWLEVGTMFVHWDERGHGVGNNLAREIARHLPNDNLVPTSKNLAAVSAFKSAGYSVYPYADIPTEVRQGLCYTAPCFSPNGNPTRCTKEHDLNGPCIALIRNS